MRSLETERDALLLYILQHPPPNVSLKLPDGCASLERIDLTTCPSPITLYIEAEKAAQHANGKRLPQFEFDMTKCFVLVGGSSGNVRRVRNAAPLGGGKPSISTLDLSLISATKTNVPSTMQRQRSPRSNSIGSPPNPAAKKGTSSPLGNRVESDPPQLGTSKGLSACTSQVPQGGSSSAPSGGNKGILGQLLSALKSFGNAEECTAEADDTCGDSIFPPSTTNGSSDLSAAASKKKAALFPPAGSPTGGLLASVWSPLSPPIIGTRRVSRTMNHPRNSKEESEVLDMVQRMEQMQIPLCGTTLGTISLNVVSRFGPILDIAAGQRKVDEVTATSITFPRPPHIQLCEVVDSAPLAPFLDCLHIFAYEALLMATGVLRTGRRDTYAKELSNVYQRVFSITEEQHARSLANVTPPALRQVLDGASVAEKKQHLRYLSELRPDTATFRLLSENSSDDGFVSRAEVLLGVIERYPDLPGDTYVPLSIRAMMFAACLVPLYQLDLSTLNPIYSERSVENCLEALRSYFGISPQTEHFCHLHAQLLASDQCGSVEAQAVFLKDVARAVSHCSTTGITEAPLTPSVKYAYYVLQETFCLAAVPMPWLDSSFSADMQRSVTAAFIEICLALPPCMPSVMVLVEDAVVLQPTANSEEMLLALMDVFVNSGVFRNFAELVDDKADVQHLSAGRLFQRIEKVLDTEQRAYCEMLTRSYPLATVLIVPGRLRIGAYVLLSQHWGGRYPGATDEVPTDYKASLDALLDYLLNGCNGEQRTLENEALCSLLMRATRRYLVPLDTLARYDEAAHVQMSSKLIGAITPQWSGTVSGAQEPSSDVTRVVRTVFGAPRAPPLGGDPAAQQNTRLRNWLDAATALTKQCMEGFPSVAASATDGKIPLLAAESRRVRAASEKLRGYSILVPGAVHRLNILVRVQKGFDECIARSQQQYNLVRCVTGASPVPLGEIQNGLRYRLDAFLLQLCDCLSIYLLTQDAIIDLMSKYSRLDAKKYRSMKRSGTSMEEVCLPRLYPAVTIERILDELRHTLEDVCSHIQSDVVARQLQYRLSYNFTACLFALYLEEPGVFLSPADASLILSDLEAVRAFLEAKPRHPDTVLLDVEEGGVKEVVQSTYMSSVDLLDKLYSVVQYVMSTPSSELVTGGVGVPPLHRLPECSDDSPWCQYVVRRVLEHRKEFKMSMWESYITRVLSH